MTLSFLLLGGAVIAVSALALVGLGVYAKVKMDPTSTFSQNVTRLWELNFVYPEPTQEVHREASDRPTRIAVAAKTLKDLQYGDKIRTSGALYTVVSTYTIHKLEQRGSATWVNGGSVYHGLEVHPVDDDPLGRGGGVFIMQLPIRDDRDVQWVVLARVEYEDLDRDAMYGAASAFGKSQGRDQAEFVLKAAEGNWSVRDIGTSRITTNDQGGTFTGSVQVAHVMMRTSDNPRNPHSVAVWFDYRPNDSDGTGDDTLAVGQVIDPQQVTII